jgi:hypothetical protein
MLGIAWSLGKKPKEFFYIGLGFLAFNVFATIVDELGTADFILLGVLIASIIYLWLVRHSCLEGR